jgi:hypothetical protein
VGVAVVDRDRPLRRESLYTGDVGVALLLEELSAPTSAGLPLYEPEGWPLAWEATASRSGWAAS